MRRRCFLIFFPDRGEEKKTRELWRLLRELRSHVWRGSKAIKPLAEKGYFCKNQNYRSHPQPLDHLQVHYIHGYRLHLHVYVTKSQSCCHIYNHATRFYRLVTKESHARLMQTTMQRYVSRQEDNDVSRRLGMKNPMHQI
ncbi:hypothetical protein VNO77_41578 [Canavalia gladiata]|uniref:Uncharacterized protein n=1 Tax=Canavalia gladiata TaxID=3824 RepID=A0AAN9K048_CANGL